MRYLMLTMFALCTLAATYAAAQSAPASSKLALTIAVTNENGVAVPSARVSLQQLGSAPVRCQTDFSGRCRFFPLSPGTYQLRIEKEGYYVLQEPSVPVLHSGSLEVSLTRQLEVREEVNVVESPPAIDPAQISSQERLSGLDVLDIPYPVTHDYRNVLNFIPGVVNLGGQPHIAGAETYETVTLLDGFNITQPANGQVLARVSSDAFRSITVEASREPAEYGKGSGGLLALETGIGDDHFRYSATDFIPSFQQKHGLRFDQLVPRVTFSGPLIKGKAWFYDAIDGEYDNTVYTELPAGADNDHLWRIGNLAKAQANLTNRNILTASVLVNELNDQYAYFSPLSPQLANPSDAESAYIASLKDQHYFSGGELLETGVAFSQYNLKLTPYGDQPYFVNPQTSGGNYYLFQQTKAERWQGVSNVSLRPRRWLGSHDLKFGIDLDHLIYNANFARQPISYLSAGETLPLSAGDSCLTAPETTSFPCTRYSSFGAAVPHQQSNDEVSAYAQDRWLLTDRLLIEPGLRFDWDEIVRASLLAPRLAGTYVLDNSGNTKLSAGIDVIYDATPLFLIARPYAGTREDTFFTINPACASNPGCSPAVLVSGPVATMFSADTRHLQAPRYLNWSLGVEHKLPKAIYLKAELLEKRGSRGFVYDTLNGATSGDFVLQNTRRDSYDAFQVTARHKFRENYMLMGSYTRSRSHSNQVLDFNADSPILSAQEPGPYPWDAPNRFLSWGYMPFVKLPLIHRTEIAYSMEARTGFPFDVVNEQQQLAGLPGSHRFPEYFSLNLQLEKRFHLFGRYWALRGGFDNITDHANPAFVDNVIGSPTFLTFSGFEGRGFTGRIRLLGRK